MSFADLHSARRSKQASSYIATTHSPDISTDEPTTSPAENCDKLNFHTEVGDDIYRSFPVSLQVRSSNMSGRSVWTTDKAMPGTTLMMIQPHVAVLSNQYLDSHCSSCCGPAPPGSLQRCSQCQTVWYCHAACQKRDWGIHKFECAALRKWASFAPSPGLATPGEAIRCLGRMVWGMRKQGVDSIWSKQISMMQSHRSSLPPSATETHTHLAHSLVRYLGVSSPVELGGYGFTSAGDLVDIISRFTTNTFTLTSPSLTPMGIAVSPPIALINHSCDPNAVIVFPRSSSGPSKLEPLMHVIALRKLSAGEEILTAYIDTTLPRERRQQFLKETYNFTCQCRLCIDKLDVDPRESMVCPKSCGSTCPTPTEEDNFTRCTKCKSVVSSTDAVLDAIRIGQEALDKATLVQSKDPSKALQLTTNLIPILTSAGLTPPSHPLLALTRLHQSLLISSLQNEISSDTLDEAIRAAAKSTAGLSELLCEGHPVRGIAFAELGKILAVDEPVSKTENPLSIPAPAFPPSGPPRLKLAYETLVRARNELLIGFGKANDGGQVGQEIREAIVSLEKEIGIWSQGVRNVIEDSHRPAMAIN